MPTALYKWYRTKYNLSMFLSDLKPTTEYLSLDPLFYHKIDPTPLHQPYLVSFNKDAADLIGLDHEEARNPDFVEFLNGATLLKDSIPYAMCYAGHQFGYYVPRLGDGRAINLGSVNGWQLQLKGAGKTRYSRGGDGRAVLRSSIREYLMSEAIHALGIPTTRALAMIGSGEKVLRSFYEKGAIVLRMSPSWIRIGSFEYFYHTRKHDHLQALAEYTIKESFPHLVGDKERYLKMFEEVVVRTAKLIAQWQAVGFNHGVMNTDNLSIAGLTIDYGPFAFLDDYDIGYICNHTDIEGRYSFGNQPYIGEWNLSQLLQSLTPLVDSDTLGPKLLKYRKVYEKTFIHLMREKLGLFTEVEGDINLIQSLFDTLQQQAVDYTLFFRTLSRYHKDRTDMLNLVQMKKPLETWLDLYDNRLTLEHITAIARHQKMKKINPKYVLKNHMLQDAIDLAENGDFSGVNNLLMIAQSPYDEHPEFDYLAEATPNEYKNLQLSCSS